MQICVDLDAIFLHKLPCSLIVSLALHALNLSQELSEELTQALIVVDAHIGLAVAFHHFHDAVAVGIAPSGNKRTVAHVRFLDDMSGCASSMTCPGLMRTSCVIRPFII